MEKGTNKEGDGNIGVGIKRGGLIMADSAFRRVTFFVSRCSNRRQANHHGTTFVGKPQRTPQQRNQIFRQYFFWAIFYAPLFRAIYFERASLPKPIMCVKISAGTIIFGWWDTIFGWWDTIFGMKRTEAPGYKHGSLPHLSSDINAGFCRMFCRSSCL